MQRHVRRWLRRRSPVPSLLTSLQFLRVQGDGQPAGNGPIKSLAEQLRDQQEAVAAAEAAAVAAERLERRQRRAAEREAKGATRRRQAEAHSQMLAKVAQMQRALRGGGAAAVVVRTGPAGDADTPADNVARVPRRYGDGRPQTSPGCANRLYTVPPAVALDRRRHRRRQTARHRQHKGGARSRGDAVRESYVSSSSDEGSSLEPPGAARLPRRGVDGIRLRRRTVQAAPPHVLHAAPAFSPVATAVLSKASMNTALRPGSELQTATSSYKQARCATGAPITLQLPAPHASRPVTPRCAHRFETAVQLLDRSARLQGQVRCPE